MARKYPRFLWSNPTNSKSEGPFIVHTQVPQFLAKPHFDDRRNLHTITILEVWNEAFGPFDPEVEEIKEEIFKWFDHSGRSMSIHPSDKIIWEISGLGFLKENQTEYSVEQAREIIRILFPTKSKNVYKTSSSYTFKHLLERISMWSNKGKRKFCDNAKIIQAFELEGFIIVKQDSNALMNLSAKEVKTASLLYRG